MGVFVGIELLRVRLQWIGRTARHERHSVFESR